MAVARCVLPVPTVLIKNRFSIGARKSSSVMYSCVKPLGSSMAEFQTNSSNVFSTRNPAVFTMRLIRLASQFQKLCHILLGIFIPHRMPALCHAARLHLSHHQFNLLRHELHRPSNRHRRKDWGCSSASVQRTTAMGQGGIPSSPSCSSTGADCQHRFVRAMLPVPAQRRTGRHFRRSQSH